MSTNKRSGARWLWLTGHLGLVTFLMACMVFTGAQSNSGDVTLRLDNNVVTVKDSGGNSTSFGNDPTFEFVGEIQSLDPWKVGGVTLKTGKQTQTEAGLKVGDLVKVTGVILEGKTWMAYSIKKAETQTQSTTILIGKVTSMDPWVVDGFSLNVTADTIIDAGIEVGTIVRVEIILLEDDTWEVIHISPLSALVETSGCVTVIATVVSVNGSEVQFLGWPTVIPLDSHIKIENATDQDNNNQGEDEGNNEGAGGTNTQVTPVAGTLSADQVVMAVFCTSDNGQIVIVQIIILNIDQESNTSSGDGGAKVLVCHKPNKNGGHTLSLPQAAIPAHLGHGDTLGACP
ncbi:MAG: DUF5666 domain-containing protein [Chloroflexota bacterium]